MERRIAKVVQITVVKGGDWAKDVESKGQGCKLPDVRYAFLKMG